VGALQAQDKRFAPGDVVLLHDLKGRPELNGCYASVVDGPLAHGRFRLRRAAGDVDDVAPENLLAVSASARGCAHSLLDACTSAFVRSPVGAVHAWTH
jgi:hypothetical protein